MGTLHLKAQDADELFKGTLAALVTEGDPIAPRGKETVEFTAAHLTLRDPTKNVVTDPTRQLNYSFMIAEWLWIVTGRNDVRTIGRFNKQIKTFSDDGRTFAGAYGPRLLPQLPYVLDTLMKDPSSRQAVATIWTPNPRGTADVPCTTQFQFLVRHDALQLITTMRSNDAWLGLPYDLFNFTQLQRQVAQQLGVGVGEYHHQVGSLHLYDQHFHQARVIAETDARPTSIGGPSVPLEVPATVEALLVLIGDAPGDLPEIHKLLHRVPDEWRPYAQLLARRVNKEVVPDAPFASLVP